MVRRRRKPDIKKRERMMKEEREDRRRRKRLRWKSRRDDEGNYEILGKVEEKKNTFEARFL